MRRWLGVLCACAWLWACDDGAGGGAAVDQALLDGGAPDQAPMDGGGGDGDAAVMVDEGPAPDQGVALPPALPTLQQRTPQPVVIDQWMLAAAPADDPVIGRVRAGTLTVPEAGEDATGMRWEARVPAEDGGIGDVNVRLAWAVTAITVDRPTHWVVRADAAFQIFVDGHQMPGDVYRSGALRVPFKVMPGEHIIAARVVGGRGAPRLNLWETADPAYLNVADLTAPDWPVGSDLVQWLGVPVLFFEDTALRVIARVVENAHFHETATEHLSLPGQTVTQVAFELVPKAPFLEETEALPVTVQIEVPGWGEGLGVTVDLQVLGADQPWRRSRRSHVDGSAQYYGVRPPTDPAAGPGQSLVVSLHGAGVQGIGQARSYGAKDFAWIIAPTNRRPFGFDWEDWGRLDALEALDDATAVFETNPTQTYLTGHSMGGHGTWHLAVNDTQRFAVVGPSAGWSDFWNYARDGRPTGLFARSQAYSFTETYVSNLAQRGVFIIHGTADDNVPFSEGERMLAAVEGVADEVDHHWEPDAGHWWDGDRGAGADCVDWPDLFAMMQRRSLPAVETDFQFTSPGAWYSRPYSFVHLRSSLSPLADLSVTSARAGDAITLTTDNVRSLTLDGDLLTRAGITEVVVDGEAIAVQPGPLPWGPQTGKRPGAHGPINEVFYQPWCAVVADVPPRVFLDYARYLIAYWALIGNGQGCLLRLSEVTDAVRAERNLVYLGLDRAALGAGPDTFDWDDLTLRIGDREIIQGALLAVFPEGDRLSAILTTTAFDEALLFGYTPFGSANSYPDFLVFGPGGGLAAGFFDADWQFNPATSAP